MDVHQTQRQVANSSSESGSAQQGQRRPVRGETYPATVKKLVLFGTARSPLSRYITKPKETGIFQEEITLLGEKQTEASQVDLLRIHFHLGEVRVVGQIQGQTRSQTVFQIDSCLEATVGGSFSGQARVFQIDRGKGFDLQVATGADPSIQQKITR